MNATVKEKRKNFIPINLQKLDMIFFRLTNLNLILVSLFTQKNDIII